MQDLTRSFAGESKDTEKFDLYMAATHFAETIENLVTAQELVDEMEGILHKQSSVFEERHLTTNCTPCLHSMAAASTDLFTPSTCCQCLPIWCAYSRADKSKGAACTA